MANDIIDINVSETVDSVSITVNPNLTTVNINQVTGGLNQTLQSVTDLGSTTSNSITANSFIKSGGTGANVLLDNGSTTLLTSIVGTTNLTYTSGISNGVVNSNTGTDATIPLADSTNAGLFSATEKTKLSGIASGAEVNVNADWNAVSGDAEILNKPTGLATTTYVDNKDNSQQLQLNYLDRDNSIFDAFYLRTIADGGTVEASNQLLSSLAVLRNISYVNQGYTQQINADKFVKLGGAADEYLMADGSISYGGGGGGGATNLTTTQTISNFTINSNTGTDATVPLGNGTLAGATLNDYTTAEKTKLSNISGTNTGDQNLQSVTNLGASTTNAITANSFVKSGGTSSEILAADGSVITAGTNITITGGQISSVGGAGGGGSSVNYYLNGGTSQGTFGGTTYYEFSKNAVIGTGADFNISSNGYIASFITDVADPSLLLIPAGNWNLEFFFSASSNGGSPSFYVELYKYDGTTFTSIASSSATPEGITSGTSIDAYFTALAVPETVLTVNDRLAIRVFVNASSKTITLHTQNGHLCEVITTFTSGLTALNGLQAQVQNFATGTTGTDFDIVSSGSTHTFNLPSASATARGVVTTASQTFAGDKTFTGNLTAGRYLYSGGSIFPEFGQTFYINGTASTHYFGGGVSNVQNNLEVSNGTLKLQLETASTIASFDANKNVVSLPIATYPSLTELALVKGVSGSSIQTQLNGKQPLSTVLTNTTASFTIADETKLDGIAAGATANSSDATLLARANHTGTQLANTISDFNSATRAQVEAELVAGTNITITPSGTGATRQLTIDASGGGSSSQSAYTMLANNTASTAVPTERAFENLTNETYSGTIVWAGGAAPSGTTTHTYSLSQIGNLVTLTINLSYATAGAGTLTSVACELPSTATIPALPTSVSAALDIINYGTGVITPNKNLPTTNLPYCALRIKSVGTPNVYEVVVTRGAAAYRYAYITIQYFV